MFRKLKLNLEPVCVTTLQMEENWVGTSMHSGLRLRPKSGSVYKLNYPFIRTLETMDRGYESRFSNQFKTELPNNLLKSRHYLPATTLPARESTHSHGSHYLNMMCNEIYPLKDLIENVNYAKAKRT